MTLAQIKTILLAAGVKPYALTDLVGENGIHVSFADLPSDKETEERLGVQLAGHLDVTDKGVWFFAT